MKLVWVELDYAEMRVIRIFKSRSAAFASGKNAVKMQYSDAVGAIRHQLWLRCKGECELCASVVTETSGHMHEQKHRGKGGEYSLENGVFICARTHTFEHRDRSPHWTKKDLTSEIDSGSIKADETPRDSGSTKRSNTL